MSDLKQKLDAARMTHRDLAAATGYSPGAVWRWVDGTARPPAHVVAWLEHVATVIQSLPPAPRRVA
jgi:transcriptional regulator with XRE-family HTH domain